MFDREEAAELLRQLGQRLHAEGLELDLYVVGGAAMMFAYDLTRATSDIDAAEGLGDRAQQIARSMAEQRRDLAPDWLNSNVQQMASPSSKKDRLEVLNAPGIRVTVPPASEMLAMKVRAGRPQDMTDILRLTQRMGITDPKQAIAIAEHLYGPGMISTESAQSVHNIMANPQPTTPQPGHRHESQRSSHHEQSGRGDIT